MLGPKEKPTRILLAIIALLVAVPGAARAADILINNGLDCSNPGNVIDHTTYQSDTVRVRNVGCGTPDPWSPCPSPGAATEVCVVDGGSVDVLYAYDSSTITIAGCYFAVDGSPVPYGDLTAQTGTLTGKVASSVHPIDSAFSQGGGSYTGTITLVHAPSIPVLPKWGYLALAGGLIVVGAVVMRRRSG
jgi:hypothetical protein